MRYYLPWLDSYYARFEDLSDAEYGALVRCAQKYAMTGHVRPVSDAVAKYLPDVIEEVKHYIDKCERQAKRCAAAGRKGGRPQKSNNNNNNNNKNKNNDKDNDNERVSTSGVPPSLSEVEAYCQEAGLRVNAAMFWDYYTARGWLIDGQPIVNWQAQLRIWARRERGTPSPSPEQAVSSAPDAAEVERMRRLREQLRRGKEVDSTTT